MSSDRFEELIRRIDHLNQQDPHTEQIGGTAQPYELVYSQRLTEWVLRLNPSASEELRIAARGQHVQRWTIPRDRYERTRAGYLRWREVLKTFHAKTVGELMRAVGYPEEMIRRVQAIMSKRGLPADADTQVLEDALCLVFLETQFADLKRQTPDEKMATIVRKTWLKMSPQARQAALALALAESERQWLVRVLEGLADSG